MSGDQSQATKPFPTILRPMSEAPRDGTPFWGRCGQDAISMLWHPRFDAFVSGWRILTLRMGLRLVDQDGNEFTEHEHSPTIHQPDGWLPLPGEMDKGAPLAGFVPVNLNNYVRFRFMSSEGERVWRDYWAPYYGDRDPFSTIPPDAHGWRQCQFHELIQCIGPSMSPGFSPVDMNVQVEVRLP